MEEALAKTAEAPMQEEREGYWVSQIGHEGMLEGNFGGPKEDRGTGGESWRLTTGVPEREMERWRGE